VFLVYVVALLGVYLEVIVEAGENNPEVDNFVLDFSVLLKFS